MALFLELARANVLLTRNPIHPGSSG